MVPSKSSQKEGGSSQKGLGCRPSHPRTGKAVPSPCRQDSCRICEQGSLFYSSWDESHDCWFTRKGGLKRHCSKRTAENCSSASSASSCSRKSPFTPYQASSADGCQKNTEGAFRPDRFNKRGEYLMVWGTGLPWEKAVWQTSLWFLQHQSSQVCVEGDAIWRQVLHGLEHKAYWCFMHTNGPTGKTLMGEWETTWSNEASFLPLAGQPAAVDEVEKSRWIKAFKHLKCMELLSFSTPCVITFIPLPTVDKK